jgi:hypothetical protein
MGNKAKEEEEDEEGHKGKTRRWNTGEKKEQNQREQKEGTKEREKQIHTTTIRGSTQSPRATIRGSTQSPEVATPCYKSFLNIHPNVISSFSFSYYEFSSLYMHIDDRFLLLNYV